MIQRWEERKFHWNNLRNFFWWFNEKWFNKVVNLGDNKRQSLHALLKVTRQKEFIGILQMQLFTVYFLMWQSTYYYLVCFITIPKSCCSLVCIYAAKNAYSDTEVHTLFLRALFTNYWCLLGNQELSRIEIKLIAVICCTAVYYSRYFPEMECSKFELISFFFRGTKQYIREDEFFKSETRKGVFYNE